MLRIVPGLAVFALLCGWVNATALAQVQTKDQQKCLNALAKDFEKVGAAQGKALADCIKGHATGKLPEALSSCLASPDKKGKVQKAREKTEQDHAKLCVGTDKAGLPKEPDFGTTTTSVINEWALDEELEVIKALFGDDPEAALLSEAADKDASKCQQALAKTVKKCQQTKIKEYGACKKAGLRDGTLSDAAGLESCIGADPKGKIAGACNDPLKPDKIRSDIQKKCADKGVDLAGAFAGCGAADAEALHACVEARIECQVCLVVNAVDGLARDCDLFDDGAANQSCPTTFLGLTGRKIGYHPNMFSEDRLCVGGDRDGEPCTDAIAHSDCPPGPGGNPSSRCLQDSFASTNLVSGTLVTLPLTGDTSIDCDEVDPVTGIASCQCEIEHVEPVEITMIGFVCFVPFAGCPRGEIDCDGGNPSHAEVVAEHETKVDVRTRCGLLDDPNDTGPGAGNAECRDMCDSYCAQQPGSFTRLESYCEGYCQGGVDADKRCEVDAECPGGFCAGGQPVAHRNFCHCQCLEVTGAAARPGGFYCQTGVSIVVESDSPCDGTDVTSIVGKICGTNSTESAHSSIRTANAVNASTINNPVLSGQPTSCDILATGGRTEAKTVGHRNFFDTSFGDMESTTTSVTLPREP